MYTTYIRVWIYTWLTNYKQTLTTLTGTQATPTVSIYTNCTYIYILNPLADGFRLSLPSRCLKPSSQLQSPEHESLSGYSPAPVAGTDHLAGHAHTAVLDFPSHHSWLCALTLADSRTHQLPRSYSPSQSSLWSHLCHTPVLIPSVVPQMNSPSKQRSVFACSTHTLTHTHRAENPHAGKG